MDQQQPRIQKGKYRARAAGGQLGNSSQKGTPYVALEFELREGELAGERLLWFGWLTPAAEDRTLEALRYCGWKTDDLDDLAGITDNDVELVIDHEKDQNGVLRARVAFVNRVGGLQALQPMTASAAKEFALKMKGKAAASRVKTSQAANGATTEVPTVDSNGKPLPF